MAIKANKIAEFLDSGLICGNPEITKPASLNNISKGSLVFTVNSDKDTVALLNQFNEILALVGKELSSKISCPHIAVDKPRLAFAKVVKQFFDTRTPPYIAKTAVLEKNLSVGQDVTIGEYSVIGDNVVIGDRTEIRHHVVIAENTIIGRDCLIRSNSVIGEEGMGIASDNIEGPPQLLPQLGNVLIGNNVETGTFTTINRGSLDSTEIKDNVKIGHHVNIGHNVIVEENAILTSCCEVSGSSIIEKNVWIGINACVLEYIRIGERAKVGMGSVVVKNVEPNKIVVGNPAKVLRERKQH